MAVSRAHHVISRSTHFLTVRAWRRGLADTRAGARCSRSSILRCRGGRRSFGADRYERTRLSGNSPFDRWQAGHQASAISDAAKLGASLFNGTAQCAHCHSVGGGGFHNTGIGWDPRTRTFADLGHYTATKGTVFEDWPGTFKAPTLREVSRHPPYMHDGSIATLHDVVEFYNRGAHPNPYLDGFIHPLGLSEGEVDALVAFLNSLNGEGWQDEGPSHFPQ